MKAKQIALTSLFAVLLFISSYFKFPIGPVPVTTQTFFVIVIGMCLPLPLAFLATTISAVLQIVFQGAIPSPTFGFVLGFIVCAVFLAATQKIQQSIIVSAVLVVIASLFIYAVGIPYFMAMTNGKYDLIKTISLTFTPFILGDTIKAVVAMSIAPRIKKLLR